MQAESGEIKIVFNLTMRILLPLTVLVASHFAVSTTSATKIMFIRLLYTLLNQQISLNFLTILFLVVSDETAVVSWMDGAHYQYVAYFASGEFWLFKIANHYKHDAGIISSSSSSYRMASSEHVCAGDM